MKVAGLFAGIGGLELGLCDAGYESTLLCDSDLSALAVLETNFRGVPLQRDVTRLSKLPCDTHILTAGFPCQDLSQVGRTAGIDGANSGLVKHVFDLVAKQRVDWILLENVPFLLRLNGGYGLNQILRNLETLGYSWAYRVIDTMAFGLPQRRERVYILASRENSPEAVLFRSNSPPRTHRYETGKACGFYWTEGNRGIGWAVDAIPTLKGGSSLGIPSAPAIWMPSGDFVTPHINDAEALQGFESGWTEPAETVNSRSRWRLVGNAVSVPVAKWIGDGIRLKQTRMDQRGTTYIQDHERWPTAAFGGPQISACKVNVSKWPVAERKPSLLDFLSYEPKPLSQRAATGFLTRLQRSRLNREAEFEYALEQYVHS